MAEVRLSGVVRQFGRVRAVDRVDLEVRENEFIVFLGPSGCGKTTTLRCVAGLEPVDAGRVFIGGRDVTGLPPGKRNIGMVFQSYAIFPHMSVAANIAFGLRIKGRPKDEIGRRVRQAAELLELGNLLDRFPAQLSGGQRQRVAVARAVVVAPAVLLMDEPLSNLDALLRLSMRAEIKRLHKEIEATTVYVTHDQVEALSLGDRIAVMKDGRIVQCDAPQVVYDEPASTFVGGFIGSPPMNFLTGRPERQNGILSVVGNGFRIPLSSRRARALAGSNANEVVIGIRPEYVGVRVDGENDTVDDRAEGPEGESADRGAWTPARVVVNELVGAYRMLTVDLEGQTLKVMTPSDTDVPGSEPVWLRFDPEKVRLFDPGTGKRLAVD